MPSPSDPSQSNVIPLSQAHAQRRGDEFLETSESRIEDILKKVLGQQVGKNLEDLQQANEEISQKIGRLQNSMDRIISQFTAIKNGKTEDPALVVTTDMNKADLAVVGVQMYQEDYYTHLTKEIAKALDISIDKVVKLSNSLGLRNNSDYHKAIKSGENKSGENTYVQKYSQPAFDKIKQEVEREKGLS